MVRYKARRSSGLYGKFKRRRLFAGTLIVAAHERAVREGFKATDDAMVVERMGQPVFVIEGEA